MSGSAVTTDPSRWIRVMTYNVHACLGLDRARSVPRITDVVRHARPDVAVLQEIDVGRSRSNYRDQARAIAEPLGMSVHFTEAIRHSPGSYGLAVLTRGKLDVVAEGLLPRARDERRAAQWLRLQFDDFDMDLVHLHLSVRSLDRRLQLKELLSERWLAERVQQPYLVVCGDLNATPRSYVYRNLRRMLSDVQLTGTGSGSRPRSTWPANFPLLRLDHIFIGEGFRVRGAHVSVEPPARRASDHLPLIADLEVLSA